MPAPKPKVLVAMSGGVDSSVAAALLVREGYEVIGCFMRLGTPGEALDELRPIDPARDPRPTPTTGAPSRHALPVLHRGCCSISDAGDARLVAAQLGVPLYVCNFKKDFARIIDYFVDEYAAGRTPNPCVRCNDWLKFGKLHEYAGQLGCGYVASGHYARVRVDRAAAGTRCSLLRARDAAKDQSYVLFGVPSDRLARMLLPIGDYPKPRVRELAREFGLPVSEKPDSQEICFVPDDDYAGLVERRRPALAAPGRILDTEGRTLGTHRGQHRFTIGQRRGLGLATVERRYVVAKDPVANTVTIGEREQLLVGGCAASGCNWLVDPSRFDVWSPCLAKFRYNTPPMPARARLARAGGPGSPPPSSAGGLEVRFDVPQPAVAAGQAVVLYDTEDPDVVLGGGWIDRATPA